MFEPVHRIRASSTKSIRKLSASRRALITAPCSFTIPLRIVTRSSYVGRIKPLGNAVRRLAPSAKRLVRLCGDLAELVASAPTCSGAPVPGHACLQVEDEVPAAGIGTAELRRSAVHSQFRNSRPHLGLQGLPPALRMGRARCDEKPLVR